MRFRRAPSLAAHAPAAMSGGSRRLAFAMGAVALWTFALALPAIGARASHGARVTADEPQYLITAISIGEDLDLDIRDELDERRFEPFHEIDLDPQTIDLDESGRRVSPHDPLLPALLALPMRLGGWEAAKTVLAAMAALTAAATLWLAVQRFGVPLRVGGPVVGAFYGAPPLTAYATQVYPEMPAALCLVLGLAAVTGPSGRCGRAAALCAVIALPWLSVKYVPVAAVIAGALVVRAWPRSRRRAAADIVVLAVAGIAYLVIHRRVYGGWTVYASGDHFMNGEFLVVGHDPDYVGRSRRLVGLLVDRGFGLAAWTPAYLLAAPALAALSRRRPSGWIVTVAALSAAWAVATWLAVTMHGWWWPGRQVVVALPAVVVAVASLVHRFPMLRWPTLAGCAVGTFSWLWLVVESSTGSRTLVTDFEPTANPVYRAWSVLLPDHRIFDGMSIALTAVWSVLLAVAAVWAWLRSRPPSKHHAGAEAPPPSERTPGAPA